MKRGVSCLLSNAPCTKGVTGSGATPKLSSVQEPSKAHLESATHKYRVQRGTRAPLTDSWTMNHVGVDSGKILFSDELRCDTQHGSHSEHCEAESHRQANCKAHMPGNNNSNNSNQNINKINEMPSLWRISGTSKAYQESATAKWRNKKGKTVDD
jgi:hypothetical protein